MSNGGVYTLIVSNGSGCDTSITVNVTINANPSVVISASDDSICNGQSAVLTASGASTYTWSNSTTGAVISVAPPSTTTYTVTGTSSGGCEAIAEITIFILPDLVVTIAGEDTVCAGTSAVLAASGASTYYWNTGANTATLIVSPFITTTYSVTGTGQQGCQGSDLMTVNVLPLPVPVIQVTEETCNGAADGLMIVNISGGQPPFSYAWNNGETGNSLSNIGSGNYSVTVTDAGGCSSAAVVLVESSLEPCYIPGLYVPNIFSPNGDGNNDVLFVRGNGVRSLRFFVCNRWGQKVFESESLDSGWDGTLNGNPLDEAVFMYYLKATMIGGETKIMSGSISLVR